MGKKQKIGQEKGEKTGLRPKSKVVSPSILKITRLFEKSKPEKITEKGKTLSEVLKRRNAIEEMMCDSKARSIEKSKIKPKKKIIKTTEKNIKNETSEIEKWIKSLQPATEKGESEKKSCRNQVVEGQNKLVNKLDIIYIMRVVTYKIICH